MNELRAGDCCVIPNEVYFEIRAGRGFELLSVAL
jgi:hypothetical protein